MKSIKYLAIMSTCLLAACAARQTENVQDNKSATVQVDAEPNVGEATNKSIPLERTNSISSFEIQGALAAKSKSKGWSATMNWVQHGPGSYQIRLMGPLGGGSVLISKQAGVITFKDGNKTSTSNNADELLYKQTGIRLPVSNLYYWVRGLPAPGGAQAEQHDKDKHLVQLKQNGYTITFNQYTSVNSVSVPKVIRLEGNGIMIKVAIKKWSV